MNNNIISLLDGIIVDCDGCKYKLVINVSAVKIVTRNILGEQVKDIAFEVAYEDMAEGSTELWHGIYSNNLEHCIYEMHKEIKNNYKQGFLIKQ